MAGDNMSNGGLCVENNEHKILLAAAINSMCADDEDRMAPHQAAETLWTGFLGQARVSLA